MKEFAEQLAHLHSLALTRQSEGCVLAVPNGDLTFEVTIPDTALEWFAVARQKAGLVIWEDWADYYPIAKERSAELAQEMRTDLQSFVASLVLGEFRATQGRVERFHQGAWSPFGIGAAT